LNSSDYTDRPDDKARDEELAARMSEPAFAELHENEQFILTVTRDGYGKRSSAYEYRISGRGGQGITAISLDRGDGEGTAQVVASFAVIDLDQVIMVTDGGQIIRTSVNQVTIVGRSARGVRLFNVAKDEDVVSVSRIREAIDDEDSDEDDLEAGADGAENTDAEATTSDDAAPEAEAAPEEDSGS